MNVIERRASLRYPLKLPFSFELKNMTYSGLTGNISLTGLFIEKISPRLKPDFLKEKIIIQLDLDNTKLIFRAKIVYVSELESTFLAGVGLEFMKGNDSAIKSLKNHLLREALN